MNILQWLDFKYLSVEKPEKVIGLLATFHGVDVKGIITDIYIHTASNVQIIRWQVTDKYKDIYRFSATDSKMITLHSDKERMLFKLENDL